MRHWSLFKQLPNTQRRGLPFPHTHTHKTKTKRTIKITNPKNNIDQRRGGESISKNRDK